MVGATSSISSLIYNVFVSRALRMACHAMGAGPIIAALLEFYLQPMVPSSLIVDRFFVKNRMRLHEVLLKMKNVRKTSGIPIEQVAVCKDDT